MVYIYIWEKVTWSFSNCLCICIDFMLQFIQHLCIHQHEKSHLSFEPQQRVLVSKVGNQPKGMLQNVEDTLKK